MIIGSVKSPRIKIKGEDVKGHGSVAKLVKSEYKRDVLMPSAVGSKNQCLLDTSPVTVQEV